MYNQFNQMGYGQQQNAMGYDPNYGMPRLTKGTACQMVCEYVLQQTGVAVTKMTKIDECPSSMRHACVNGGIQSLPQYYLNVPSQFGMLTIYFYFCNICGKLFIYDGFM